MVRTKTKEDLTPHAGTKTSKEMVGVKYGRLTVLGMAGRSDTWTYYVECLCECGELCIIGITAVKSGKTISCGCYHREVSSQVNLKHGQSPSYIGKDKTYTAWQSIKQRCFYKPHSSYERYGGIGTKMCAGYKNNFSLFKEDIGNPPSLKHSVDRRNSEGHYSCGKCAECINNNWEANIRWADQTTQDYNKKTTLYITIGDKKLTVLQAVKVANVPAGTIRMRLYRGWTHDDAVNTPIKNIS